MENPITRSLMWAEEDVRIISVLAEKFTSSGWKVEKFVDASAAYEQVKKADQNYALYVVDIFLAGGGHLPPHDFEEHGLFLIHEIRQAKGPRAKIAVLSQIRKHEKKAIDVGANLFISKFEDEEIIFRDLTELAQG